MTQPTNGGGLILVGDDDAPACEDGVCEVPVT